MACTYICICTQRTVHTPALDAWNTGASQAVEYIIYMHAGCMHACIFVAAASELSYKFSSDLSTMTLTCTQGSLERAREIVGHSSSPDSPQKVSTSQLVRFRHLFCK